MHISAQRESRTQENASPQSQFTQQRIAPQVATASPQGNVGDREIPSHATSPTRFAHDFSRIPVHSHAHTVVQPKLIVNAPGDIYEQEADRLAGHVLDMPEPALQRACACGGSCSGCQKEEPVQEHQPLQTKHVGSGDSERVAAPPIVHEALASPGQPLDAATRDFMEPRFGHDFSRVRVHTDESAEKSASAINAHAYTVGNDIVFRQGRFDFNAAEGRRLLAHELTHVVQQTAGRGQTGLSRRAADSELLQRKDDKTPAPKPPKCDKGCAGHWGKDTNCSKWGFVSDVRNYGSEKWRGIDPGYVKGDYCCNSWPFALEQYAINDLDLDGAASCHSWHQREIATVTTAGREPIKVLCSDAICEDASKCKTSFGETNDDKACWNGTFSQEVIELSPNAMLKLSGNQRTTLPVSVCYSGSQEMLCPSDGPGPAARTGKDSFPEAGDCLTKGCTPDKNSPKLKDTGWPNF